MDIARDQRIPRVMIPVAGQDYAVGLDSGALGEFCLPAIRRLPLVGRPVLAHLAISLGAQTPEKVARLATNIVLGGLRFERPIVGVDGGEGRIGAGVLRHFRVDLNQRDGWVCLTPSIDGPVTNKSVRSLGLWLAPPARGFEVMGVIPGTDAARAHIRPGDIVTRLNSESASRWTRARRHDLVEETDLVEVELVRGNQTCQHRLQVAVLVE